MQMLLLMMGEHTNNQHSFNTFFVLLDVAGTILLIENTRSSNPILGYYQDVTASTAADMGGKGIVTAYVSPVLIRLESSIDQLTNFFNPNKLTRMFIQPECRGNDTAN